MSEFTERRVRDVPRPGEAERLLIALRMMSAGITLRRAGERARHPDATDEEIERRVQAWLCEPEPPDEGFRVVPWPGSSAGE